MGKAKDFYALSGILLLAGWASILFGSGIRYGIDFKVWGTNVDVRFAQPPNVDKLRGGLAAQGIGNTEIQSIGDIANPNTNEVVIFVEGKGQDESALESSREKVLTALNATYSVSGLERFQYRNSYLADRVPERKRSPDTRRQRGGSLPATRQEDSSTTATKTTTACSRISANSRRWMASLPQLLAAVKSNYVLGPFAIRNVEVVGPKVGAELRKQAIYVTLYALGGMLVYIAIRFEWVYGAAAVLAVFHDVLITLGFFSLLRLRDFADGHRRPAYSGRLFNERHDRHLRSHS